MPPTPEDRVRQLAKQNTTCPNCHQTKKFGFGTICIKFHTFVCNECKTSHQAVSHRCKSITMSSWTHEEVDELEQKGNAYCEATWLAKAPPIGQAGRPTAGSSIDVFKRFVVDAYEHKRYFSHQPISVSTSTASSYSQQQQPTRSTHHFASSHSNLPAPAKTTTPSFAMAPASRPVADFLDFASFDAPPAVTHVAPSQPVAPTPLSDPFAPTQLPSEASSPAPSPHDLFAGFASVSTTENNNSSFAFLNGNATNVNTGASDPVNKKPVMNAGSMNGISNMPMINTIINQNTGSTLHQSMPLAAGAFPIPGMHGNNSMMMNGQMSFMNNGMQNINNNMMAMGGMHNHNNAMMGMPFHASTAPVMSYHGGSSAISNMNKNMQQKQQKQKDAFSDLLPF